MERPRLVSEEQLYKFYGKGVTKRTYQLPDGAEDDFYVFTGTMPVIIFALTRDGKVIAVKQFRYGVSDFVLEIPGGIIDSGDTPEQTVKKELLEETGYSSDKIIQMGKPIWFDPAAFTVAFLPALALLCRKTREPDLEKTEVMETVLVPLQEWLDMIFCGLVRDSKSIATTFLALRHLGWFSI